MATHYFGNFDNISISQPNFCCSRSPIPRLRPTVLMRLLHSVIWVTWSDNVTSSREVITSRVVMVTLSRGVAGCEYGDRATWCKAYNVTQCKHQQSVQDSCCFTCNGISKNFDTSSSHTSSVFVDFISRCCSCLLLTKFPLDLSCQKLVCDQVSGKLAR